MSVPTPRRILVGVGNAGVTVLDLLAVERPSLKGLLVVNGDTESLAASIIPDRITVPGGDMKEGFLAIEEEFGAALAGAGSVIFCGGLGGETGTFLLPALVARAKAAGIVTMACVGMPFTFEGKQKRDSASAALTKLYQLCDAVSVIDNDRLSGDAPSTAAVGEAFQHADNTLLSSLLALQGMLATSGPVRITRNDLSNVLGSHGSLTHFGHGKAEGSNRLHEAIERALKCPLLTLPSKGSALRNVPVVLLLLRGPKDISFAEVQVAVAEMERLAGEKCQIKVGVNAEEAPGAPLELFILASSGGVRIGGRTPELTLETPSSSLPPDRKAAATPVTQAKSSKAGKTEAKSSAKQTQGVLELDSYQRGRFDKSEPTIIGGEDLDIPTFLRRGIKLSARQPVSRPPHQK